VTTKTYGLFGFRLSIRDKFSTNNPIRLQPNFENASEGLASSRAKTVDA